MANPFALGDRFAIASEEGPQLSFPTRARARAFLRNLPERAGLRVVTLPELTVVGN